MCLVQLGVFNYQSAKNTPQRNFFFYRCSIVHFVWGAKARVELGARPCDESNPSVQKMNSSFQLFEITLMQEMPIAQPHSFPSSIVVNNICNKFSASSLLARQRR